MNSKTVKNKSIFFIFLAAIFFAFLFLTLFSKNVVAYANYNYSANITLTNSTFESSSYSSSTSSYTPSSWKVIDGSDEAGTVASVIPLSNTDYTEYTENPGTVSADVDRNIFMLKSKSDTNPTKIGYKNSSAISLAANGFYKIDVLVYTDTLNNGASIYISGLEQALAIENINTSGTWQIYSFFIKTSAYKAESVFVELWLGSNGSTTSSGRVFFDNIKIEAYSEDLYTALYNSTPAAFKSYELSLQGTFINALQNANFENGVTGWEIISGANNLSDPNDSTYAPGTVIKYNGVANTKDPSALGLSSLSIVPGMIPSSNNSNTKALFLRNVYPSFVTYSSTTGIIVPQHSYYRISVFVKTQSITSGGATIKLVQDVPDGQTAIEAKHSAITSVTGLAQFNGFAEYVFYVEGNPFRDTSLKVQFSLGTDAENLSDGIVVFDNILIQEVSYSTFNSNKSNSQTTSMTLHTATNTTSILNGAFNFVNSTPEDAYPLNPKDWTINESSTNSGIININKAKFDSEGYPFTNPGVPNYPGANQNINETLNNLLVIAPNIKTNFTEYKSSNFTLSANSITEISFYVNTQGLLAGEGGFNARIQSGDVTIVSYLQKAFSNGVWTKYSLFVKTGLTSFSSNLIIGLGSSENPATNGYAFVDNIAVETITDTVYLEKLAENNPNHVFTNLETNGFNNFSSKNGSTLKPTTLTPSKSSENVVAGIIDISIPNSDNPEIREGASDNYILMIKNLSDDNFSYTTSLGYTLSESGFYKVSVWINTSSISTSATEDTDKKLFAGANFIINNTDVLFNAIGTGTNGWEQYTYYIKATDSQTLTITFGLGNDVLTTGYVYFDDLSVVSVNPSEYSSAVESKTVLITNVTGDDEEKDDTTQDNYKINYWILIPSLALGATLIAAILSVSLRKIKFKKKVKVKTSQYDRTKSLNADIVKRELAKQREEKIEKINESIKIVNKSMQTIKENYQNNLKALTNKNNAQSLFTKYAKQNTKLQKELDKLNSALTFITDENNIKAEELREIKLRDKRIELENKITTKNAAKASKKEKGK